VTLQQNIIHVHRVREQSVVSTWWLKAVASQTRLRAHIEDIRQGILNITAQNAFCKAEIKKVLARPSLDSNSADLY